MNAISLDPTLDTAVKGGGQEPRGDPVREEVAAAAVRARLFIARPIERYISKEPKKDGGEYINMHDVNRAVSTMIAELASISPNVEKLSKVGCIGCSGLAG